MGRQVLAVIIACASLAAACSKENGPEDPVVTEDEEPTPEGLPRLHARRGEHPGIFDEDGRQVVLRAVNLNSLGHYAQNNPSYEPTRPLSGDDWDLIAAEGFNAVRLLVSWSALEPERGKIDADYVEEIRQAVRDAANRGIYAVIDMHQDAWGPYVGSPAGTVCPPGREPSNGWDGAPQWATPSPAEFDSCRGLGGEAKPGSALVTEAWHRFYLDTDGVQTRLVAVWEHLAEALADEPSVAGYDLLNEPGHGRDETAPTALLADFAPLGAFYSRAVDAIRDGESRAGIEPRPVFFEPTVVGNPVPADFSDDPGLVYAPHLYGGSIASFLTVDQHWTLALNQAAVYRTSVWAGEFGWWSDPGEQPELVDRLEQFAAREDGAEAPYIPAGSAWWQWTTGCGDPHAVTSAGLVPEGEFRQYRVVHCPDGEDRGVVPEFQRVLTRPSPRFAPGRITGLTSDGAAGTLELQATEADPGGRVELWVPGDAEPKVGGTGIAGLATSQVGRGWRVSAEVCAAEYHVSVGEATEDVVSDHCLG